MHGGNLTCFGFVDNRGEFSAIIEPESATGGWGIADPYGRILIDTVRKTQAEAESAAIERLGISGMELAERGYSRRAVCAVAGSLSVFRVNPAMIELTG